MAAVETPSVQTAQGIQPSRPSEPTAPVGRGKGRGQGQGGRGRYGNQDRRLDMSDVQCLYCKGQGHFWKQCWKAKAVLFPKSDNGQAADACEAQSNEKAEAPM